MTSIEIKRAKLEELKEEKKVLSKKIKYIICEIDNEEEVSRMVTNVSKSGHLVLLIPDVFIVFWEGFANEYLPEDALYLYNDYHETMKEADKNNIDDKKLSSYISNNERKIISYYVSSILEDNNEALGGIVKHFGGIENFKLESLKQSNEAVSLFAPSCKWLHDCDDSTFYSPEFCGLDIERSYCSYYEQHSLNASNIYVVNGLREEGEFLKFLPNVKSSIITGDWDSCPEVKLFFPLLKVNYKLNVLDKYDEPISK